MKFFYKAVALAVAFVFFSVQSVMAITWVTANQSTIQWDAVTADVDGDPIAPGTHIEYKVWLTNKQTDPNKNNPVELTQTANTEYTITLNVKGTYIPGVSTVQIDDTTAEILAQSDRIAWGDNPDDCKDTDGDGVGNDFGIRFFAALPTTKLSPKPVP